MVTPPSLLRFGRILWIIAHFIFWMISFCLCGYFYAHCGLQCRKRHDPNWGAAAREARTPPLNLCVTHSYVQALTTSIHCKIPPTYGCYKFKQTHKFLQWSFELFWLLWVQHYLKKNLKIKILVQKTGSLHLCNPFWQEVATSFSAKTLITTEKGGLVVSSWS